MNSDALPFVSVIVPVFNDQNGIDRCVNALITQSYPQDRYEIIVVDNNSEPAIRLKDEAGCHIQLLFCGTAGSYAARNEGIECSRGEILAFTDADCVPIREWLDTGVAALSEGGRDCVIGGDVQLSAPESGSAAELYQYVSGFPQRANVNERNFAATANLLTYRALFDRVGLFNTQLLSGGDLEWCLRAAAQGIKVMFSKQAAVVTSPRINLSAAIRQARRVAGGRVQLRRSSQTVIPADRTKPHKEPFSATVWILKQKQLSLLDRLRVLFVAILIKVAHMLEVLRLKLGGNPERR
jgi:glycosyltransferase involved in cell wall biosynthesis